MNTLQKRILAVLAILVAAGVAAYWYWSPWLAMRELRDAAVAADAARFNEHVDFPRVRASLKSQFSARMQRDPADAGNNLGSLLAGVLVDKLIDTAVRPETIMFAMREGKFKIGNGHGSAPEDGQDTGEARKTVWRTERQGLNTILFHGEREGGARGDAMALVMQRQGFADWKLTDIRLPD
ncbi:DUF2939 domain-containing protein [Massilia aerilata]|uniref:DUF2939 domain-containing protein n=1 Tax=Massilia aerilata TaxID=453817 RepID=A0ABW0S0Q5_9BURK